MKCDQDLGHIATIGVADLLLLRRRHRRPVCALRYGAIEETCFARGDTDVQECMSPLSAARMLTILADEAQPTPRLHSPH